MINCKNCQKLTKNKKFCSRNCQKEYKMIHFRKRRSKLEKYLFRELKKQFKKYKIESCNRTILNGLEIDIFFPGLNLGIEVNGRMHYEFVKYFHKTEKRFQEQLQRDILKRQQCIDKEIFLIEIKNNKNFTQKFGEEVLCEVINQINNYLM